MPPLFHSSIGVLPIDVVDVDSAVVAAVEPGSSADGAGIRPGDLITTASGGLVNSALQLQLAVNVVRAGEPLPLVVRDAAGATKSLDVRVEAVPNVVSLADVDLPSNKLALDYAYRASALSNALEETAVRLNMAAVSMRLRNWSDATRELEHVVKVAGEGGVPPALVDTISGTAQFMLGLAAEATGDMASAERAWRTALQSRGNLLTSTGEPIKDMAEQRLSQRAANVRP